MTRNRIESPRGDIHVVRGPNRGWLVTQGKKSRGSPSYRIRAHAVAFARALAYSSHADMIGHDLSGIRTRHTRASLSYPTLLN